jgi:hypothetical protein
VALAAVAALATTAASELPASAALNGCRYPYVCVYNGSQTRVGQFVDRTPYFQTFSRSDVTYAFNTRHDDVAYFLYSSGRISCVAPGRQARLTIAGWGSVTGIRLDDSPQCFP